MFTSIAAILILMGVVAYLMTPEERARVGRATLDHLRRLRPSGLEREPIVCALKARTRYPLVTITLIAVNTAVFAWMQLGHGTGIDGAGMARKAAVVERAVALHADAPRTPFETLRRLGGREIAAIAGAVLQARRRSVPVVLDGFICCAAVAPLAAAVPAMAAHCIAGHCSAEPGHARLLGHLGLDPLLRLDMRLGEGSGAAVAVQVIRSALVAHGGMATFAEAGVSAG